MLKPFEINDIKDSPEIIEKAAVWFNGKWGVPVEAYIDSMKTSLSSKTGVPQWYVVTNDLGDIIAGLGVIDNDFHKRRDLTPNICAVYVEKEYRLKGMALSLLDRACDELYKNGIEDAYIITSHTRFYERCGWKFYDMIEENDGNMIRCYQRKTQPRV